MTFRAIGLDKNWVNLKHSKLTVTALKLFNKDLSTILMQTLLIQSIIIAVPGRDTTSEIIKSPHHTETAKEFLPRTYIERRVES